MKKTMFVSLLCIVSLCKGAADQPRARTGDKAPSQQQPLHSYSNPLLETQTGNFKQLIRSGLPPRKQLLEDFLQTEPEKPLRQPEPPRLREAEPRNIYRRPRQVPADFANQEFKRKTKKDEPEEIISEVDTDDEVV